MMPQCAHCGKEISYSKKFYSVNRSMRNISKDKWKFIVVCPYCASDNRRSLSQLILYYIAIASSIAFFLFMIRQSPNLGLVFIIFLILCSYIVDYIWWKYYTKLQKPPQSKGAV